MNMSFNGADAVWVVIAGAFGIASALIWLYIGWRAMAAHERLAKAVDLLARESGRADGRSN
jgi:hypothetical protein